MYNSPIFSQIVNTYKDIEKEYLKGKKWYEMSEEELLSELCFCLLSSFVPYELANSATLHLHKKDYINPNWILDHPDSEKVIAQELSRPLYEPTRKNGLFRRYRFPNKGAKSIVYAVKVFYSNNLGILFYLKNFSSGNHARKFLVKNIKGLGFKEASHFLRNIKYAENLAILDVHILSFMKMFNLISKYHPLTSLKKRLYLMYESVLQDFAKQLDLSLSILDMAIWNVIRKIKRGL